MNPELEIVHDNLRRAHCPEDIFGVVSESEVNKTFRRLMMVVHPDRNGGDPLASDAFKMLVSAHNVALARLKHGGWGDKLPLPGKEPLVLGEYTVTRNPVAGDLADVYMSGKLVIKLAHSADDSDLLRSEREVLKVLRHSLPGPLREGIPKLEAVFSTDSHGSEWKREANVLTRFEGFYTAERVRARAGAQEMRTLVWMFKRLLVLLEHVHKAGYVHGAILPPHVMFYPDNDGSSTIDPRKHALRLIDWCYSLKFAGRTRLSAWAPAWEPHYAPELISKSSIGPASDLYMAAKLIAYLSGRVSAPAGAHPVLTVIPNEFAVILERCTETDPAKRYKRAGDVFTEWVNASKTVYGSPSWFNFNLPKDMGE